MLVCLPFPDLYLLTWPRAHSLNFSSLWYSQPRWSHLPQSFKHHLFSNKSQLYSLSLIFPYIPDIYYQLDPSSWISCRHFQFNMSRTELLIHTLPLTRQTTCLCSCSWGPLVNSNFSHLVSLFRTLEVEAPYLFNKWLLRDYYICSLYYQGWRSDSWTYTHTHIHPFKIVYVLMNLTSVSLTPIILPANSVDSAFIICPNQTTFHSLYPFPSSPCHHRLSPGLLH